MTKRVQTKALYHLNFLKSMGYEYLEYVKFNERSNDELNLPNDLSSLEEIAKNCHLCQLSKYRANVLFGQGHPNAKLMFIGDEPSISEDEVGEFFVGRSGTMLVNMIENAIEMPISATYITNIVKCRTSHNIINSEDANTCRSYLDKQIELVKPQLIVALGEVAYDFLVEDEHLDFSKNRGQIINSKGHNIMPTFHPNYLLRNPSVKKEAYFDMLKIKAFLEK